MTQLNLAEIMPEVLLPYFNLIKEAFFSNVEHHSDLWKNLSLTHKVSQTTIDYISIYKNAATIFSALGIIADIYNLVMFIIFGRIYLSSNPIHQ